jgi:hypothetical protein
MNNARQEREEHKQRLRQAERDWIRVLPLYTKCLRAIEQEQVSFVYVSWLMAVCFKQSLGEPYFHNNSGLIEDRLNELPLTTVWERKEFLRYITVTTGEHKDRVPRFKYDRRLESAIAERVFNTDLSPSEKLVLSCRWGITQAPLVWYCDPLRTEQIATDFMRFVRDPNVQLMALARVLKNLSYAHKGDVEAIFDKLFSLPGSGNCWEAPWIVSALNAGFSAMIAERDMKQCIYSG